MALPELVELIPLHQPVAAEVTVPGSKSITNRALVLAALADGTTTLRGALWSEDTQVMVDCLQRLGFEVRVENDPAEPGNRTIQVKGHGGTIPKAGSAQVPLDLFVGNAGTAARFLSAFVCLGNGAYRLHGVPRMHERPQAALFKALRQLGYRIEAPNDKLPATIVGQGRKPGRCHVSIAESSQFASALFLCAGIGGWTIDVEGENEDESPYVAMTSKVIEAFPKRGGTFQVEPDASSGSYFWAAGVSNVEVLTAGTTLPKEHSPSWTAHSLVRVANWPTSGWQIDARFPEVFGKIAAGSPWFEQGVTEPSPVLKVSGRTQARSESTISRQTDLGDSIMTAIAMAPLGIKTVRFTDLGRLRLQECERVTALRTELTRCGAAVVEDGDTLVIDPSALRGAVIETYGDHRMAMCFAILGLKVAGIKIKNPACVKKTFPNFFQKLAAPGPAGLGAAIQDPGSGRKLSGEDLFAS